MKKKPFLWAFLTLAAVAAVTIFLAAPARVAAQSKDSSEEHNANYYSRVIEEMMSFIKYNYVDDVDYKTLYEGAMKGMFESLGDPYSVYLTESDMEALSDTTTGHFGGVGLYISKHYGDTSFDEKHLPYVRVVAPIEDTPAYKLGISAGDYIVKVEDKSTENMPLDEVTDLLRGEPGTVVNVTFLRGDDIIFTYPITRAVIEVPTVKSAFIDKNIGYLRIIQFTPDTPGRVKEFLDEFTANKCRSLVIDLRSNPGGLLSSVVEISNYFLSGDVIVSTKSKIASENHVYKAGNNVEISKNIPIAVLIDRGSASAAEILSAALHDNGRAVLIGETTFGKGSVQQVRGLGKSGFKLTMSKYYTPKDENINKIGIAPDKEVKEREFSEDEKKSYKTLLEESRIQKFVKENPAPSAMDITAFIKELSAEGIVLDDRYINKMIRNELNKTNNDPPVYDLEFDIVLQEAVRMLQAGEIKTR